MIPEKNPTDERIKEIINMSAHKAARWLTDSFTRDTYYWPAEEAFHREVASELNIEEHEKGIVTLD